MKIALEKVHLDLKVNWKLSRNQTTFKENYIVHLETANGHFRSEIAPNIRYGETPASIMEQFTKWSSGLEISRIQSLGDLERELPSGLAHSLRFGLESAFISSFAKAEGKSVSAYLGLPPAKKGPTSYTMPIIPVSEIEDYLRPLQRFQFLKIKVNAETGTEMLREIRRHASAKMLVDANEGWTDFDAFMKFHESLKGMNIELIEQPFPSTLHQEYRELKKKTPYKLLADESIEDAGDFSELSKEFHAINVKLMKTGSLIKARDLIREANKHGMESMIGCMIETTIGISYGMLFTAMTQYVDLDGFLLIRDEPYNLVCEEGGLLFTAGDL